MLRLGLGLGLGIGLGVEVGEFNSFQYNQVSARFAGLVARLVARLVWCVNSTTKTKKQQQKQQKQQKTTKTFTCTCSVGSSS